MSGRCDRNRQPSQRGRESRRTGTEEAAEKQEAVLGFLKKKGPGAEERHHPTPVCYVSLTPLPLGLQVELPLFFEEDDLMPFKFAERQVPEFDVNHEFVVE